MIKVALPNKGLLFEPALQLLNACGYRARKPYKTLTCLDPQNNIEFYFLRPSDIPMYVGEGIIELGITGLDLNEEKGGLAQPLLELDFGQSKLCAAVPNDSPWQDLAEIAPRNQARESAGEMADQAREVASDVANRGSDYARSASRQVRSYAAEVEDASRRNPLGAVATALLVGVAIGYFGRGRR